MSKEEAAIKNVVIKKKQNISPGTLLPSQIVDVLSYSWWVRRDTYTNYLTLCKLHKVSMS